MGLPTAKVELQRGGWYLGDAVDSILATSTYLTYASFADVTSFVRNIATRRGRNHELDRVEAGTGTVTFRNRGGEFDPTNLASPYSPDVRPMVRLRLSAEWAGVTYPLMYAFVESWPQVWTRGPNGDAWVTVTLSDGFKPLNLDSVSITRPVEKTGARISAVLDAADWSPGDREIATGLGTVQAQTLVEQSALSYLQTVAQTEGGPLFMTNDGKVAFQDRSTQVNPTIDPEDVWGDSGIEKDYENLVVSYDDASIWNAVTVTAPNLADGQAEDEASQGRFFRRLLSRSTIASDPNELQSHAEYLVARYANPAIRITTLELEGLGDDTQWPRILSKDLHDRVRVRKRPPSGGLISQDSFIEGIRVDVSSQKFKVTWALSPLDEITSYWVLDSTTNSVLDSTTRLFF